MQNLLAVLAVAQLGSVGYILSVDGVPRTLDAQLIVLVLVALPIVIFIARFSGAQSLGGSDSLIGLEIEARKAELRRKIAGSRDKA